MRSAIGVLALESITVVYPGRKPYRLDEKIEVVPLQDLARFAASW
jgi:hypothetical protein